MPHFDHLPREESDTETETESSSSVGVVRTKTKPSKPKRDILAWTENVSKESLDDFLSAHQPSKTKNSADGWIWVRSARNPHANLSREEKEFFGEAVGQAMQVAEDVMKKAEGIKNDPNVPVRTSKKGPGRRDQLNKQGDILLAELKKIGTSSPALATGKWMWFEPAEKVDTLFSVLARSLIDGPLARLGYNEPEGPVVHTLKVATADSAKSDDRKDQQFLICLYFDSIWEKKHAKEVLHSLAAEHGVHHPSAAKADLYTYVNLTSNHPTKARSSNWRPTELILTDVYDDLKEAFWQMKKSGDWDRAEKEDREQFRKIVGGRGSLGVGEAGGGPGLAAGVGEKVKGKGKGKKDDGDERTGTESKPNSPPTKVDRHPSATAGVGDLQATASGSSTKIMPPPRTKVIKPTIVAGKPIAFAQDSDSEEDDEAEAERARERARRGGLARLAAREGTKGSAGPAKPFISHGPRVDTERPTAPQVSNGKKRSLGAMQSGGDGDASETESETESESEEEEEEGDAKVDRRVIPPTKRVRLGANGRAASGSGSASGSGIGAGKGKQPVRGTARASSVSSQASSGTASE